MSAAASILVSFSLLGALRPQSSQEHAPRSADPVAAVLAEIAGPEGMARAAQQLARLRPPALAALFERLCSGENDLSRRAALLGAFALVPGEELFAFLARIPGEPGDAARRETALDLLARSGGRGELKLVLELGPPEDAAAPPSAASRTAVESALYGICSRDRGAARVLVDFFPRATAATQTSIVAVLARLGGDGAVSLLAGLLGKAGAGADALLLLELSRTTRWVGSSGDLLVFERVRAYLGHPDPRLAVLASVAARVLGDHGAVPDLILLLEDARVNVRRAAHAALLTLTGLDLSTAAKPWLAWLDEALAWWDERADPCRVALVSGVPAEAAAALAEIAEQRLFLQEVAPLLVLAARRSEADIVAGACRALGRLPGSYGRKALLALSARPDLPCTEPARAALRSSERPRVCAQQAPQSNLPLLSRTP